MICWSKHKWSVWTGHSSVATYKQKCDQITKMRHKTRFLKKKYVSSKMVPFMNMWLLLNWMLTASVYLRLSKFGCGLTNEQQKNTQAGT